MNPHNVGSCEVLSGQLLTLYAEDKVNGRPSYIMLYVKKSFDLSQKMVEYYHSLSTDERTQHTEVSCDGLYRMLLKQGLVEKPRSDLVLMGEIGRPSKRLADEVRYSINPEKYKLEKIRDELQYVTKLFYNHQGYRIMLIGADSVLNEAIIDVLDEKGMPMGNLKIGVVFDRTSNATIDSGDTEKLKETVQKMIRETGYLEPVRLGAVKYNFHEMSEIA